MSQYNSIATHWNDVTKNYNNSLRHSSRSGLNFEETFKFKLSLVLPPEGKVSWEKNLGKKQINSGKKILVTIHKHRKTFCPAAAPAAAAARDKLMHPEQDWT